MSGERLTIQRARAVAGAFRPPSDKSLTHRAYMFAAAAESESHVRQPLRGEDCESTLRCMNQLGLRHEWLEEDLVRLIPTAHWSQPTTPLDCGNSGTTMRLLAGLVASHDVDVHMIGDASLTKRPMKRIAVPLRQMGALFEGDTPPLRIKGGQLQGIDYQSPVASGQIKSCILLAGLRAEGSTKVTEPAQSRDHTERMLTALGVKLNIEESPEGYSVELPSRATFKGFDFNVPADISSTAFFLVAGALLPEKGLTARDLNVNPSRTGVLDVLKAAGAEVELQNERAELGEPVADVHVTRSGELKPFRIDGPLVPRLIDEIPVLAVLATQCEGRTVIADASEVRVKESDRIEVMAEGLRRMGANIEVFPDGMAITGPTPLTGIQIDAKHDHRIAMAFAIAGLIADGTTTIDGAESIATSYPNFMRDLQELIVV